MSKHVDTGRGYGVSYHITNVKKDQRVIIFDDSGEVEQAIMRRGGVEPRLAHTQEIGSAILPAATTAGLGATGDQANGTKVPW